MPHCSVHLLFRASRAEERWLAPDSGCWNVSPLNLWSLAGWVTAAGKCSSSCWNKKSIKQRENLHSSDWWPNAESVPTTTLIQFLSSPLCVKSRALLCSYRVPSSLSQFLGEKDSLKWKTHSYMLNIANYLTAQRVWNGNVHLINTLHERFKYVNKLLFLIHSCGGEICPLLISDRSLW